MEEEKSLANTLKALPDLLRIEQTYGLLATIVKQWGLGNSLAILLNTVRRTGLVNSLTSLLSFKLDILMPNLLISMWDSFGQREALISGSKRFTFREFKERVLRLASGLQDLGLKPKDKIAIMLYNGNEYVETMFASWFIGCITPLVNWHFRGQELETMINRRTPKVLVIDEEFIERINEIKNKLIGIEYYIVVGEKAEEGGVII